MISNQVLQNTLEGLKEISRTEFCVLDTEGKVLASTFTDFSIATQDVQAFVESQADSQLVKGLRWLFRWQSPSVCWVCSWIRSAAPPIFIGSTRRTNMRQRAMREVSSCAAPGTRWRSLSRSGSFPCLPCCSWALMRSTRSWTFCLAG